MPFDSGHWIRPRWSRCTWWQLSCCVIAWWLRAEEGACKQARANTRQSQAWSHSPGLHPMTQAPPTVLFPPPHKWLELRFQHINIWEIYSALRPDFPLQQTYLLYQPSLLLSELPLYLVWALGRLPGSTDWTRHLGDRCSRPTNQATRTSLGCPECSGWEWADAV